MWYVFMKIKDVYITKEYQTMNKNEEAITWLTIQKNNGKKKRIT